MSFVADRILSSGKKSYGMYSMAQAVTGRDLIHLELGMPIHDTPQLVKDATTRALNAGEVHYSDFRGIAPLRDALSRKLAERNGLTVSSERILVTNGLTHASYVAFMATINPGDEVILLDPYYPQHVGKILLCGGVPVMAPMDADNGFSINPALITPRITERTKAIVLVNPCNPTGRVFTRAELQGLADLAIAHNLLIIADEVYEQVLFDQAQHVSIASLPGMAERTITTFAFTKAYAMDGWRLGYVIGPDEIMDAMVKVSANMVTHVNTFIQHGALAAVTQGDGAVAQMMAEDRVKRDIVVSALNQMPGVTCDSPQGTIYAFANIKGTGMSSQALAEDILAKADVVVESGSFYGANGEGHLRICFGAESDERLTEAMRRLGSYFNRLSDRHA